MKIRKAQNFIGNVVFNCKFKLKKNGNFIKTMNKFELNWEISDKIEKDIKHGKRVMGNYYKSCMCSKICNFPENAEIVNLIWMQFGNCQIAEI